MSDDKPGDALTPRDVTILRPRPGAATTACARARERRFERAGRGARWPPHGLPVSRLESEIDAPRGSRVIRCSHAPNTAVATRGHRLHRSRWANSVSAGANPLLQAAVPLLVLAGRLRGQIGNADIESLHRQAITEISTFEQRSRQAEVPAEDVLAARYALCTVIDEAVLNTPWGAQSDWSTRSLLVTFHREAAGGEKFFQILDRVSGEPQRYLALLELLYVCLAIGFEGKYRLDDRGGARLANIRENALPAHRSLARQHGAGAFASLERRRRSPQRRAPLRSVVGGGRRLAALLVGAYIWFDSWLGTLAEPVNATLARVGPRVAGSA